MDQQTSNNSRLWDHIASSVSNGWAVTNREFGTETVVTKLTQYPVRIYPVHMGTAWMAAGSTTVEMMVKAREQALQEVAQGTLTNLLDQVTHEIDKCAELDVDGTDDRCNSAIARAAIALASTRTYEIAATKSLVGHWLQLVYPTHTDSLLLRPAFLGTSTADRGLMSPQQVLLAAKGVLDFDLTNGGSICESLKVAGGPKLAAVFQIHPMEV